MAALQAEGELKQCDIVEYSTRDWQKSTFLSSYFTSLNSFSRFVQRCLLISEKDFRPCATATKGLKSSGPRDYSSSILTAKPPCLKGMLSIIIHVNDSFSRSLLGILAVPIKLFIND